jgi:hypothetical protein
MVPDITDVTLRARTLAPEERPHLKNVLTRIATKQPRDSREIKMYSNCALSSLNLSSLTYDDSPRRHATSAP